MTRRGRPVGEIGRRALQLAEHRPVTYLDLHLDLGLSRRDSSVVVFNLVGGGLVDEIGRRALPGYSRKPVPVVSARPPSSVEDKLALLASWPARRSVV